MATTVKKFQLPDGGVYTGEVNSIGIPHGKGECLWSDGTVYNGSWINGEMHGVGLYTDKSGYTVKGFWMQGKLIHNFSSQDGHYEGQRDSDGKPHGKGTYEWSDKRRYEGSWISGKMHGVGAMHYPDGRVTKGFWYEGELLHTFSINSAPKKLAKNANKIIALLIGNNYTGTKDELSKCISDVEVVGQKLRNIGVDVTIMRNASETDIHKAIKTICSKDNLYEHAIFYFSGHGQIKHYNYNIKDEDGKIIEKRILGPLHTWIGDDFVPVYQEWDLLKNIKDSQFKNIVIINDACQTTRVYEFDDLGDADKWVVLEAYTSQNEWQNRNLLTAYAALEGWTASGWSNDKCGIYALGLIQYIEQENLPLLKMFDYVNDFVVKYSMRERGEIIQLPNASFTKFDAGFCLYVPENE